jgi:hypothetical protein
VLSNDNSNLVYYFEPRIRRRIKEKLCEYIKNIENKKRIEEEKFKAYLKNLELVRIYE